MKYELETTDIHGNTDKVKIEYLRGLMVGKVVWIQRNIAEDLIERGYAKGG